ncbi:hypothetical protein D6856_03300 [Butyrivibrio sp. XB500-5]|uniref:DUF6531 domain-containing protein n=1 Tax=Butyrivibrio sp. XB500-5 TaxID=2364880 RepID=UPI000EA8782E|nr:DUF6531 domain-containing protein [Butyrivibrio sp. XB500-5]RKM63164.1 hypothetical protein D6856_03300 [Butyrivibrio sp. XB500-5]
MGDIKGSAGDGIEWHQKKTRDYFTSCFETYNHFLEMSDDLIFALLKYVNDETHVGPEADASKAFVNERQIPIIESSIYCIQKLQSMMMGSGFESNVPLLEDFIADMAENEEAVIKSDHIEKVIEDFAGYNTKFKAVHPKVKEIHDLVEEAVRDCKEVTRKSFTNPNPAATNTSLDAFVKEDRTAGFVPEFKNKFLAFHEEHSNDIEGSAFKELLDTIVTNTQTILEGLQKGTFDITKYSGTNGSLKWVDPVNLNAEQLDEFIKYLQSYRLYLQGFIDRCQVYRYDPVNLSNGNYINDRVDIEIGELGFRRFYNATSDFSGSLGRGWSCKADIRLREEEDGIKVTYLDGREGLYKKLDQTENSYYEIHGEIGILKKENGYYKIEKEYGEYEEYDSEGYLVAEGNHTGEKIRINYADSRPVKIESNNGLFLALLYNKDGVIVGVTDSEGRKVSYGYETRGEGDLKEYFLTDVTYPNGSTRKYIYDEAGRIQSVITPDGIVSLQNEYDENGRVIHQIYPDGGEMSYSYDDEKHVTTATEQNGLNVEYLSDELGRHIGTRYVGLTKDHTGQDLSDDKNIIEEKFTYNKRNQKTSVTDKNGHTTRYSYDNKGHLTRIIGPEGLNESYTYDSEGRLISKKDSEGNRYKYTYDFEGNLYSVTDPEGNRTKYDYENGKIVRIKDAESNEISIAYDENGNISAITDAAGVTVKYICDKLGRVSKTIDAEGNETGYSFDETGNITEVIDPIGNTTSYKYTKSNLLSQVINPDGTSKVWGYNEIGEVAYFKDEEDRVTGFSYNNLWKKEKMTLPNGGEILYSYDLLGNLIKTTDPEGRKTVYSHDNEGNVLSVGIESGENKTLVKTAYTYDKRGRVLSETDAEGNKTIYSYDKNGNLICKTDALGGKTSYEYDSLQRVIKITDAIGRDTIYTYDKNGNVETVTDPAGVVTRNHYSNDRLIKVTQKESEGEAKEHTIRSLEYDACGRIKTERLCGGYAVTYDYDKAGRPSVITAPNGRVIKNVYDSMGRIREQDDCGTKIYYTHTGTGKLKSITDACGNEIIYSYNELDLLCKVERKGADSEALEAHVTTFEHDLSGKLISETDALSQKTLYSYDDVGELGSTIDRDGNETVYTRDGNGNITGIRYMDGNEILYKYNALNVLHEVKDKIGLTKIDTDILGRIVKVTNPRGEAVGYEYGARDEKTAMIYPDGKRVEYSYDVFGNLTELREKGKDDKEQSIKYIYDEEGNLREKLFPNNTSTKYEYYQGGFIKSLVSTDRDGVLDKYEYTYNKKGNATQVKRDRRGLEGVSGTYMYSYDELGRLTESKKDGVLVDSYSYDAFGNRVWKESNGIKTTYSYDVLDRLVKKVETAKDETNTTSYSYDRRGNLIEEYENEVLSRSYGFNMQGLLESSVIDPESELQRKISYEYNFAGMRVSKESDSEKVHYVTDVTMDHNNLIMEIKDDEVITYTYDEDVVSADNGKNRSFYQTDELGSTMYLTGTDGAAYCSYAYDVFGNRMDPKTGESYRKTVDGHKYRKRGNIIQPFAFTGYREEEDGKYYAQAREYDPISGRFTGEDRVRGIMTIPDSVNHYLYCINDPIIYVDNNGLAWKIFEKIGSGLKTIGNGIKDFACNTWNSIKEDPCKFLASTATGILVGAATFFGATALSTMCPPLAPVFFAGAAALTAGAANAAGQLASTKDEEHKSFNFKELFVSMGAGAIGGGLFGGAGLLAGQSFARPIVQGLAGAVSGGATGAAQDIGMKVADGKPMNIFETIGNTIFGSLLGGLGGWGFSKAGQSATNNPINRICTTENGAPANPAAGANGAAGNTRPAAGAANGPAGNQRPAAGAANGPAGNTRPGAGANKPAGKDIPYTQTLQKVGEPKPATGANEPAANVRPAAGAANEPVENVRPVNNADAAENVQREPSVVPSERGDTDVYYYEWHPDEISEIEMPDHLDVPPTMEFNNSVNRTPTVPELQAEIAAWQAEQAARRAAEIAAREAAARRAAGQAAREAAERQAAEIAARQAAERQAAEQAAALEARERDGIPLDAWDSANYNAPPNDVRSSYDFSDLNVDEFDGGITFGRSHTPETVGREINPNSVDARPTGENNFIEDNSYEILSDSSGEFGQRTPEPINAHDLNEDTININDFFEVDEAGMPIRNNGTPNNNGVIRDDVIQANFFRVFYNNHPAGGAGGGISRNNARIGHPNDNGGVTTPVHNNAPESVVNNDVHENVSVHSNTTGEYGNTEAMNTAPNPAPQQVPGTITRSNAVHRRPVQSNVAENGFDNRAPQQVPGRIEHESIFPDQESNTSNLSAEYRENASEYGFSEESYADSSILEDDYGNPISPILSEDAVSEVGSIASGHSVELGTNEHRPIFPDSESDFSGSSFEINLDESIPPYLQDSELMNVAEIADHGSNHAQQVPGKYEHESIFPDNKSDISGPSFEQDSAANSNGSYDSSEISLTSFEGFSSDEVSTSLSVEEAVDENGYVNNGRILPDNL